MPCLVWQDQAVDDGQMSASEYDGMAPAYARDNADSPYNQYYERPATISLLRDGSDKAISEIGRGAGLLTLWLVEHGAKVTATDVRPRMIDLARHRSDGNATFVVGDLARPLWFASDASLDMVVGSAFRRSMAGASARDETP